MKADTCQMTFPSLFCEYASQLGGYLNVHGKLRFWNHFLLHQQRELSENEKPIICKMNFTRHRLCGRLEPCTVMPRSLRYRTRTSNTQTSHKTILRAPDPLYSEEQVLTNDT
ncbi:hypothetical protein AVEN_247760-1 [Araneus ventricosus]|uniref:Uncharacterized protein n=1 Tax=Araneus ventricosus TaxID=182803 RepID=A0A4Y2TSQ1_ARAVE|nr:hypothetical protein AVEN_247760-1 [Araneus ventricosus]